MTQAEQTAYGKELILDLHQCDPLTFNRENLDGYFKELCEAIGMVKCERYWFDDAGVPEADKQTSPHTKGTSAVQFILTSSIVVHTLDLLGAVYVNVFSCKEFEGDVVAQITASWFRGTIVQQVEVSRR